MIKELFLGKNEDSNNSYCCNLMHEKIERVNNILHAILNQINDLELQTWLSIAKYSKFICAWLTHQNKKYVNIFCKF
jgi:hypothetical protein